MALSRIACAAGVFLIFYCVQPVNGQEDASPVRTVEYEYSFVREPFINPEIIRDFSTRLSDLGDQVVAINLLSSQNSNRYSLYPGDLGVNEKDGQCPFVYVENRDKTTRFGYQYIGMTESGVHVLSTSNWMGGSGVFKHLMLLTIEFDAGIDCCDWDRQTAIRDDSRRLLIRKLGEIGLGDRWSGQLGVSGNELRIGRDEGWFSRSGGTESGPLSSSRSGHILKIDIQPRNPLDFAQHSHPYPCKVVSGTQPQRGEVQEK